MKTAEVPQDCVEHVYFIVEYLISKCYKSNSRCVFRYVERGEVPDGSCASVQPFQLPETQQQVNPNVS